MTLKNKNIILGITGGIAAYKSCELVRELVKGGADVHVILTEAAGHFVTPLTLQTLSNNPVHSDMFAISRNVIPAKSGIPRDPRFRGDDKIIGHGTHHISLADLADAVIVAPACANTIAKVAHGICDDLLSTIICATKAPVLFAPSMNVNMWNNPITQENIARLKKLKYHFVDPEEGELACGYKGVGRMADISKITENISSLCKKS